MEGLKRQKQEAESSSEDEFEKEMDMELESVMRTYENNQGRSDICAFNLILILASPFLTLLYQTEMLWW